MIQITIALLLTFTISGCKFWSDKKESTPEVNQSLDPTPDETPVSPFADDPIAKEWAAIWRSQDKFTALQLFKKKHGVFLLTHERLGDLTTLYSEGACGETYVSLAQNTEKAVGLVSEIDSKGKLLKTWRPGNEEILRVDGEYVFSKIIFYENLEDIDTSSTHEYVLRVSKNNQFEVLDPDDKNTKQWTVDKVDCPKELDLESEYKYCVKEPKSKRIFVLQEPCT